MSSLDFPAPNAPCAQCGSLIPSGELLCRACGALAHAEELRTLAAAAGRLEAEGDLSSAMAAWRRALELLPPRTRQRDVVEKRLAELGLRVDSPQGAPSEGEPSDPNKAAPKRKGLAGVGAAILAAIAKFKTGLILLASKAKLLAFGFTKLGTLGSMLLSMGLYWTLWGWKFAAGFVLSIYVHEMGHVSALRRYGVAATAPMFIPGVGALIRLKQTFLSPREDARVGLAGPLWGFGAALFCLGCFFGTRAPVMAALTHTGAFINLFNLLPIWQLDGARGFRGISRGQRGAVALLAAALGALTGEAMLYVIAGVGALRAFTNPSPDEPDTQSALLFIFLLVALSALLLAVAPDLESLRPR